MTWIRAGECNGCGACCRVLAQPVTLRLTLPAGLDPAYLAARGVVPDDEGMAVVTGALVAPCPQWSAPLGCGLHGTPAKPQYCQDFPTAPEQVADFPDCSYTWTAA